MTDVEAVVIRNPAGQRLFGTLHWPRQRRGDLPAIVLLSPGVKMRVGPGRLYVPLTEKLNDLGYTVLRFDFFGLGDSEGSLPETILADVYNNIEVGRYVDDTLAALRWLRESHGFKRFVLGGLCGGAITALLAAERDPQVEALLSIGMTVTLASNAATPAKFLTRAELDVRRRGYYSRLLQPKSWWRFLTLQSEYGVIWRAVARVFERKRSVPSPSAPQSIEQRGNANPLFPTAFLAFLRRGGRALMLFSEKDRLLGEYEEKFAAPFRQQLEPYLPQLRQHVIANANHVVALGEWQRELIDVSESWLAARYPALEAVAN
jgi:pimeloyl-ACP methyl ester carboxylesterase